MSHWLIVYRRSAGTLERCDEYVDGRQALADRFTLEREHRGDPDVEVVVLGADSLETLKVTHGRYFCTLGELAERLRETLDAESQEA